MIESIEGVGSDLQIHRIMQGNKFTRANIPVINSWPCDDIRR
jgi:hypothetical protein